MSNEVDRWSRISPFWNKTFSDILILTRFDLINLHKKNVFKRKKSVVNEINHLNNSE